MTLTIQLLKAGPREGLDGLRAQVVETGRHRDGYPFKRVVYAVETSRSGQTDKVWLKATAIAFCDRVKRAPYVVDDCTGIPDATLVVRLKERTERGARIAWEGPLGDFYVENAEQYEDVDARDELERDLYFRGASAVSGGAGGDAWLEAVQLQPGEHS